MLKLAQQWTKVEAISTKVEMLPGENHRERVLDADEEARYLKATEAVAETLEEAYRRAVHGLRALRGQVALLHFHPAFGIDVDAREAVLVKNALQSSCRVRGCRSILDQLLQFSSIFGAQWLAHQFERLQDVGDLCGKGLKFDGIDDGEFFGQAKGGG